MGKGFTAEGTTEAKPRRGRKVCLHSNEHSVCGIVGWRGGLSGEMTLEQRLEVTMWSASCRSKRTPQSHMFSNGGSGQQQGADRHRFRSRWLPSLRQQRVAFDLRQQGHEGGTRHKRLLGGRHCETSN